MKRNSWLILIIIYCTLIFLFTHSPVSTGENTLSIWSTFFSFTPTQTIIINLLTRKMTHILTFGILAYLFYRFFDKQKYVYAWLLATIYGCFDEWHQSFIDGRMGTVYDACINSLSAFCIIFFLYLRNKRKISE